MQKQSLGRRSSTNPVRISTFDREDRSLTRTDPRRTQPMKPKMSIAGSESSHIPRSRIRTSSSDRRSSRKSTLKPTGKSSLLQHGPTTPITPAGNSKKTLGLGMSDRNRSPSADRASSVGAKGPRKDTRPLVDKMYQSDMLSKIDNFFYSIQRSTMLNSNGSLKPITLKMFVEVSGFLVKYLNVKQVLTINNYVEEIPKIAKKLHYPGVINKSWLKTANAMHSWPNVLGWLCWLVEVCEVQDIAFKIYELENVPFIGTEEQADFSRHTFFSMIDLYNAWNDEKLDEEAMLMDKYLHDIELQHGVTEEDLEKARLDLDREAEELQKVEESNKKVNNEVDELHKVLASLEQDEFKQENDIKANEEFIHNVTVEIEQMNTDCVTLDEQLRQFNEQHDELVAAIKVQPMTKAEKESIQKECMEIQNYIHQFAEHLSDIQKEIYTLDLKLASANSNLNKVVLAYNKEIFMHLGHDIGVDLEQLKMPEGGALDPDIMKVLNAKSNLMNDVKERLAAEVSEKESAFEADTNEMESLQEKLKTLEEDNIEIANKLKVTKDYINKIKTDMKEEEAKLREQIKALESELMEIEEPTPNSQSLMNELEEAADKLAAVRRRREFVVHSAKKFFDKFYQILGDHRTKLFNMLSSPPRNAP